MAPSRMDPSPRKVAPAPRRMQPLMESSRARCVLRNEANPAFLQLEAELQQEWRPLGPTENALLDQMIICTWRLRRIWQTEVAGIDLQMDHDAPEIAATYKEIDEPCRGAIAFKHLADQSNFLDLLQRYDRSLSRQFDRALARLKEMQKDRGGYDRSANLQNEPKLPAGPEPVLQNEPKPAPAQAKLQNEPEDRRRTTGISQRTGPRTRPVDRNLPGRRGHRPPSPQIRLLTRHRPDVSVTDLSQPEHQDRVLHSETRRHRQYVCLECRKPTRIVTDNSRSSPTMRSIFSLPCRTSE